MSVEGISALERGFRRTPQRETLELLAGALALNGDQRRAFEQVAIAGSFRRRETTSITVGPWPSSGATILPRALANFVGREAEITALRAALSQRGVAAVHGLGGVGKSSLAREYAWRNRDGYSVIRWLNAQTEDGIIDGLLSLGATFVDGLDQRPDRRVAARQVVDSVLTGFDKPALLVFDNLEEERHLRTWLPQKGAHALITSRNVPESGTPAIALQPWPLETAVDYLRRESGRTDLSEADARGIAAMLGTLPLALSQAAASLRTMRMLTPERYLKHIAAHLKDAPIGIEYPQSVFATFKTAITQVEHEAAGAAAALCFVSSFALDAIPDELFRQPVENYAEGLRPAVSEHEAGDLRSLVADEVRLDAVLGALDRISLLVYAEGSQTYSIHRLVQLAAQDLVGPSAPAWRECAVAAVDAAFPDPLDVTMGPLRARLLPHARAVLAALPTDTTFLPAARLAERCAVHLRERDECGAAEMLQERALQIREKTLGVDHADAITSLNNLARLRWKQGHFEEAERLLQRILITLEGALGPDDPELARYLNRLGIVNYEQGRFEEAQVMLTRALAVLEKAFGPNHHYVGEVLNNLAVLNDMQERYENAIPLLTRVLAIREKASGADHPDAAFSLNHLGRIYRKLGRYEDAEHLHRRALAIQEKTFGFDHPDVTTSLNELARAYLQECRYADAESHAVRALRISETLGPDHTSVGDSLTNLADIYQAQGRSEEAQTLFARALRVFEQSLSAGHPKAQEVRTKLAGFQ